MQKFVSELTFGADVSEPLDGLWYVAEAVDRERAELETFTSFPSPDGFTPQLMNPADFANYSPGGTTILTDPVLGSQLMELLEDRRDLTSEVWWYRHIPLRTADGERFNMYFRPRVEILENDDGTLKSEYF